MLDWLRTAAPRQRWFADKARSIENVSIRWSANLPGESGIQLTVVEYRFTSGPPSLYFVPFDPGAQIEATALPQFSDWLLQSLDGIEPLPDGMTWSHLAERGASGTPLPKGRVLGVEQSNTSIRYGERLLIKVNRRLTIGSSPEAELAAVIAKAPDQSCAARTYGVLTLAGIADNPISVAICSEFVPNLGDGWSYLLGLLNDPSDPEGSIAREIDQIADVTARMHVSLTSDPWRVDVSPEPVTLEDIEGWEAEGLRALNELEATLSDLETELAPNARELARLLPTSGPVLRDQIGGFRALRGTYRIRIHGDYHLGQVLRKPDGTYTVVDFDGEPNRPLAERRDKYSALRDVAGMLRSFSYARGTVEGSGSGKGGRDAWLDWERNARDRFVSHYISQVSSQPIRLIPPSAEDVRLALGALELEKAIYECGYELSNRPEWLWLPLSRLVRSG